MTYTVKRGDSLSRIAKEVTGSTANWLAIYQQNASLIGESPNMIFPGMELVVRA